MIKVIYNKVCGRCVQSEPLTSGMVGQTIHFEYSHDFDGLTLTAVFTNGKTTVDVLNPGNQCMIPHEVLDTVGTLVKVGVYAVRGNELVIPTVYAHIGVVQKGADPSGDVSADPTLPVWAQIQGIIGNLNDLNTEAKDNLVAAVNEVKHTADSKQDKLIAGDNITIAADGKTISAAGGGSTVELDTTLSEAGKAADAKAVGDALAGKQDTLIQSGASVGQIVKISAVDDMGKPTAWEAINIPESAQPDWNQNDNTQPDYVKNRPFYSETRNVTIEDAEKVALDGFPAFVTGDTVTVNVDGVEHSLVAYYDEDEGVFTIGDIYSDLENGKGQLGWQIWCSSVDNKAWFYATEAHTISYLGVFIYKIDNKFVNFDGLVRTYNYYFKDESLYKTLYNSAGDSCTLYTCSDFILPDQDAQLFGFMNEFGFSKVDSVGLYSCFITGFIIAPMSARVRIARVVLGTDTSYMETMAADNGYTYTTNPNA